MLVLLDISKQSVIVLLVLSSVCCISFFRMSGGRPLRGVIRGSLLIYVNNGFVEERFVEGLPAKSTTEQLDIEPTLLKCQYQLFHNNRLRVLF